MNNAYSTYKKQSVTTLTPAEVVVRLYGEAERQLNRGSYYIENKDFAGANKALTKAQDVINALRSSLDMKIPVSKNLDSLYEFFNREIVAANVKKDKQKVDSLIPMIIELKEAFAEINTMTKEQMEQQEKANNNKSAG